MAAPPTHPRKAEIKAFEKLSPEEFLDTLRNSNQDLRELLQPGLHEPDDEYWCDICQQLLDCVCLAGSFLENVENCALVRGECDHVFHVHCAEKSIAEKRARLGLANDADVTCLSHPDRQCTQIWKPKDVYLDKLHKSKG